MSIHSRIVRGVGYGALALATVGFITPAEQSVASKAGYGVRFIPVREARVQTKLVRTGVAYGSITAEGVDGRVAAAANVKAVVVGFSAGGVGAHGGAQGKLSSTRVSMDAGRVGVSASAVCAVRPVTAEVSFGGVVATAGGLGEVAPVAVPAMCALVSAKGIVNPSEEELILMYQAARRSKRLQERQNYGKFARI